MIGSYKIDMVGALKFTIGRGLWVAHSDISTRYYTTDISQKYNN